VAVTHLAWFSFETSDIFFLNLISSLKPDIFYYMILLLVEVTGLTHFSHLSVSPIISSFESYSWIVIFVNCFLKEQHMEYILAWMDRRNRILALARGLSCLVAYICYEFWSNTVCQINFADFTFLKKVVPVIKLSALMNIIFK